MHTPILQLDPAEAQRLFDEEAKDLPQAELQRITNYPYDFESDPLTRRLKALYRQARGIDSHPPDGAKATAA